MFTLTLSFDFLAGDCGYEMVALEWRKEIIPSNQLAGMGTHTRETFTGRKSLLKPLKCYRRELKTN